ncbi:MAG: cytochrome c [Candidatus Acidiferrum sp.]|jgi:mono/diheme cytochrome c family protein
MTGTQSKSFVCPGRQQLSRYVSRILLQLSRVCIPVLIRLMRGALILGTSLASPCGVRAAQENAATKPAAIAAVAPTGAELYQQRCAICHGSDLKGTGPVPPPYRTPPDLSTLTRRHGGKFPAVYVFQVLKNGVRLPAHGPAEMPVWGTDFTAGDGLDKTQVTARIRNLTSYIRSLQEK